MGFTRIHRECVSLRMGVAKEKLHNAKENRKNCRHQDLEKDRGHWGIGEGNGVRRRDTCGR